MRPAAMLCALAVAGCASAARQYTPAKPPAAVMASTVGPNSEFEQAVLARLPQLEGQQVVSSEQGVALVRPGYHAANGRICRSVELKIPPGDVTATRLACSAGQAWFFVPQLANSQPEVPAPAETPAGPLLGARP